MKQLNYIIWNKKNNLNIPLIDMQHKKIVSIINSLYSSIQKEKRSEGIKTSLEALNDYTLVHFRTENLLMEKAGYPLLEEHLMLHKAFMGRMEAIKKEIISDKKEKILLKYLKEWWINHINQEDRKYVPFIKKKQ